MSWHRGYIIAVLYATGFCALCVLVARTTPLPRLSANALCGQEDGLTWNWRYCGNHARGVITVGGRKLVVHGPRFDRMERAGYINWARTPRLLGD